MEHLGAELGGGREPQPGSPNDAWGDGPFRGYADHMETPEFGAALERLMDRAARETVAILCAEAVPWRCHRSLVADALTVRGVPVVEILSASNWREHALTAFAHVDGRSITYPPTE